MCTAKAAHFATRVLDHFGLAGSFDAIYGPDLDGCLDDKGDLIVHMIEAEGFDPRRAVMIGDRGSDVLAAARHRVPAVGVLWGYGSAEELNEAGAATLCAEPSDLLGAVAALMAG